MNQNKVYIYINKVVWIFFYVWLIESDMILYVLSFGYVFNVMNISIYFYLQWLYVMNWSPTQLECGGDYILLCYLCIYNIYMKVLYVEYTHILKFSNEFFTCSVYEDLDELLNKPFFMYFMFYFVYTFFKSDFFFFFIIMMSYNSIDNLFYVLFLLRNVYIFFSFHTEVTYWWWNVVLLLFIYLQ